MAEKFMNGKGAFLSLFVGDDKFPPVEAESWDLEEVAEEINDGVNGEDRERLDHEIKHYKLSITCFNSTSDKLKKILKYNEDQDAQNQQAVDFGLKLRDKAGKADLFSLTECDIANWKWASGGQTARQKLTIPVRGRYFKKL